jgi:hypothetical protein
MIDRLKFWQNPSSWPRDTMEFVFLGRAVSTIGKALYPSDWTGEEPINGLVPQQITPHLRPPPGTSASELRASTKKYATTLLIKMMDDLNSRQRFLSVQSTIALLAEGGKLVTAWRPTDGGKQQLIPRQWWNTELLQPRFDFCRINPSKPFDTASSDEANCWVFVTQESLRELFSPVAIALRALQAEPAPPKPLQRLLKEEIEQKYQERIKSFEGKKPPTRNEDEAYFKETFGINRSRAREIRIRLAPSHWQKAGAPSKKSRK